MIINMIDIMKGLEDKDILTLGYCPRTLRDKEIFVKYCKNHKLKENKKSKCKLV